MGKITKERLENLEQYYRDEPQPFMESLTGSSLQMWEDIKSERMGLIRLARIGLWAQTHGIPLLEEISNDDSFQGDHPDFSCSATMALKELPGDYVTIPGHDPLGSNQRSN